MTVRHRIFQTGLISSLASGVFDDDMTLRELLGRGSFGLGTFNSLDGEMVVLDGTIYQMHSDGSLTRPDLDTRTPYAVVTNFVPTYTREIDGDLARKGFAELMDTLLPSPNYMYAMRISGEFSFVTTRTVARQERPYPTLVEATEGEDIVKFENVRGTLVGFRTPEFGATISVAGCHVHFIDDDRTHGGHVVDFSIHEGTAEVCLVTDLDLRLPLTEEFGQAHLTPDDLQEQLGKAEHASS